MRIIEPCDYRDQPWRGSSPWGQVQRACELAPGIHQVSTAGHGGVWLSSSRVVALKKAFPTPGRYQLSRIDDRGPVGHSEHASLADAAASACCCSRLGHLHDDGDAAARLAATVDRRGRITHHG